MKKVTNVKARERKNCGKVVVKWTNEESKKRKMSYVWKGREECKKGTEVKASERQE